MSGEYGLRSEVNRLTVISISESKEIIQLTLFNSLEVFPLIGLDNAASLSCESSSSLKLMLLSCSGAVLSFCFPFRPFFPLFFFEFDFPAFAVMLCEAVVRAVTVLARWVPDSELEAWDFNLAIDSEPAIEPESV